MTITIEGMHCDACIRRVTQALTRSGAGAVQEVGLGRAEIAAPEDAAPSVLAALTKAGFTAHVQS